MVTGSFRWFAGIAVAAVLAWVAYRRGGMLGLGTLLGVLGTVFIVVRALGASRLRGDLLHDPAVSTLVFPPEAKGKQALRPPR